MKKYIVDRFEEDFAVLEKEKGGITDIPKSLLPGVKKGDIVIEKGGKFFIDEKRTEERKASVMEKIRRLFGTRD